MTYDDAYKQILGSSPGAATATQQYGGQGGGGIVNTGGLANFQFDPTASDSAVYVQETPFQANFRGQQENIATTMGEQSIAKALALGAAPFPSTYGLPGLPDFNSSEGRQRAEDAAFSRSMRLMRPEFDRQENSLRQNIANRGQLIAPGAAGGQEFGLFQDSQNRARQDAADAAVQSGLQASGMEFGQAQAARGQLLGEQTGLRQQMFNELLAALTGQQQAGGFQPAQGFQIPNPAQGVQARQAAELAQYNAANQQSQGDQSGLYSLLGAGIATLPWCWVAREVYGADSPKWLAFRDWLLGSAPRWLLRLYGRHGEAFADWLSDKPRIKSVVRRLMDMVV